LVCLPATFYGQTKEILLYKRETPGLKPSLGSIQEENVSATTDSNIRLRNITRPSLSVFFPRQNTSQAAVIICPGGGYRILSMKHEGFDVAEWFAERGITAFVLKYRLPQEELFENAEIRPLQDAQQALRLIRENAGMYGIDETKIGIMGFSAGGHLAAMASNFFQSKAEEAFDSKTNIRPDFTILIYPVISFSDQLAHLGSKENLIGGSPSKEKIIQYSIENAVGAGTPPAFLVHAIDDPVNAENSMLYFKALKNNKIPAELHIFDSGGHGFSMKKTNKGPVASWPKRLEDWLKWRGLMAD
jgi:acetyl esterase/lipase